jgi:tetratricopeptide (TPR) repeat protein
MTGDSLEAHSLARRALAIGEAVGDPSLRYMGTYALGIAAFVLGDLVETEATFQSVIEPLEGDHAPERFRVTGFPQAIAYSSLGWALGERGRFEEGIAHGREGLRLAELVGRPFTVTWACWGLAHLYGIQGNHAEALRLLDRAIAVSSAASLLLLETHIERACHSRPASGLLDLHEIAGDQSVQNLVETLQHRPHLEKDCVSLRWSQMHTLSSISDRMRPGSPNLGTGMGRSGRSREPAGSLEAHSRSS